MKGKTVIVKPMNPKIPSYKRTKVYIMPKKNDNKIKVKDIFETTPKRK